MTTTAIETRVRTKNFDLLAQSETDALAALEQTIERGRAAFVDVGRALAEIRDRALYRGTHKTWEGYLRDRWNIGETFGRNLIAAANVVKNIESENPHNCAEKLPKLPTIETESQARELAKAEPEVQREAWSEATKDTPTPTAKAVRSAVKAVTAKRKPSPKPERPDIDPKDPPLTEKCIEARDAIPTFKELQQRVQALRRELATLCDTRIGKGFNRQTVDADLKSVWNHIKFAMPYAPCPCGQRGCKRCKSDGWIWFGIRDTGGDGDKVYPFVGVGE